MGVTVRQKRKGKGQPWWVFVAHDGKRTSMKVGDRKAAEKVASNVRADLRIGGFGFKKKEERTIPTFKLYAQSYLETFSAMNHKESTQISIRNALENHLNEYFGEMPINQIKRRHVKAFIQEMLKNGRRKAKPEEHAELSPSSVRNLKAYLSMIFSEAVDDELIDSNPALRTGKLIGLKKVKKAQIDPFTWEEKALFEKTMKEYYPREYPFFLTALRTGLRLGELLALQPGDLDFTGRFIEVRRNFTKGKITTPKSGQIRRVDMSAELATVLKAHLLETKKETLRQGWNEPPEWLFYNSVGKMLDGFNLRRRVFQKCLEKAGLRHIRIHDLRHTYATLRIMKGDNIKDVSRQLGHHSITITLDLYSHWMPGGKKAEVDELDSQTAPGGKAPEEEAEKKNAVS